MPPNDEILSALAEEMGHSATEEDFRPSNRHDLDLDMDWMPRLNPIQRKVYESQAIYILPFGERATGKTVGALHKLVKHCVRNKNALALIIVREVGQATEGGAWSKLNNEILPQWKNGNFDRKTGLRTDKGCGIDYTQSKLDASDKKAHIWISNRHGGWSMVKLISLFVGDQVEDKIKGKEPSFILVDEAQTTSSNEYFTKIGQQIGRRQDIDDVQQSIYPCNPKGPSHWLYTTFFCHGVDEDGNPVESPIDEETGHPINTKTDQPIKEFAIFHITIAENAHNLPPGYWQRVLLACKNDPVEYARMVEGLWVDKPEGDALFGDCWSDAQHIRGDLNRSRGVLPVEGHELIIGWDPGAAHTSIHFEQFIPTPKKLYWVVFDELNCVGKYTPYRRLVPILIERMRYWEKETGVEFKYKHISDNSAFNQFRARDGSFDAQDIEEISREYVEKNNLPERFIIKMKECPKGPHSVEARVRITTDLLMDGALIVSAICVHTRAMFMQLESDKDNRMKPRRSKHVHPFDSFSYPPLYFNSGAGRLSTKVQQTPMPTEFYKVGG